MAGTLKVCLGYQGERCTRLSEQPRCPTHARAYQAWRTADRASPRQRGYDAEYEANRAILRATAPPVCIRCHLPIDLALPGTHPYGWSADHYPIPLSRGGSNALTNLQPAHNRCNNSRNNRDA